MDEKVELVIIAKKTMQQFSKHALATFRRKKLAGEEAIFQGVLLVHTTS